MIYCDFLSLIGDFCLYSATVGFIIRLCGPTASPLILIGAYILSILASLLMRNVKNILRLLPPLLLALPLLFESSAANIIWLIPLFILLEIRAFSHSWEAERSRTRTMLLISVLFYVAMSGFVFLSKNGAAFTRSSVPFFFAWLLIAIVTLRLLRTFATGKADVKYLVLNTLLVLVIAAVVFVLSSDVCINAIKSAFLFIYHYVLTPIFMVVIYIVVSFPALIAYVIELIASLFTGRELPKPPELGQGMAEDNIYEDIDNPIEVGPWLGKAAAALGIFLLVLICFLIFRRVISHRRSYVAAPGTFIRASITTEKRPARSKRRFLFSDSPEDTVRSVYRRYLDHCAKHKVAVDGRIASDKICRESIAFSGRESPVKLRSIWIRARYSFEEITPDEAKDAKALLKEIHSFNTNKT